MSNENELTFNPSITSVFVLYIRVRGQTEMEFGEILPLKFFSKVKKERIIFSEHPPHPHIIIIIIIKNFIFKYNKILVSIRDTYRLTSMVYH